MISPETKQLLKKAREKATLAIVGGSNFAKQKEQLGDTGKFDNLIDC